MKVIVFGVASRVGQLVVAKALGHGHDVLAVSYQDPVPIHHERLVTRQGDVCDVGFVRSMVADADAVIFAVSTGRGAPSRAHEEGIANVIHAMAENGVGRLAVLSAAGTFARQDRRLPISRRLWIATTARAAYDELEAMERRVMATGFAWTIIRPYRMTDDPASGHYRVSLDEQLLPQASRIPRGDVAAMLVKSVETDSYFRRAVAVAI